MVSNRPESIILSPRLRTRTFTRTRRDAATCTAESDGGTTTLKTSRSTRRLRDDRDTLPRRRLERLVQPRLRRLQRIDTTSGLESCSRMRPTAGPTRATTVAGPAATSPEHTATRRSSTTRRRRRARGAPGRERLAQPRGHVTFQGTDGTSGVATCTQTTYSGPDDPSVALSGTCDDQAGNQSASALFTTKYDETPPQATATASRPADVNGWHNHPLTVSYSGSDATSGLASCDPTASYAGPDSASATISGACRDLAGNVAPRSVVVKYDATAPQVTSTPAAPTRRLYNAPLGRSLQIRCRARLVRPAAELLRPDNATATVPGAQRPGRERPQRPSAGTTPRAADNRFPGRPRTRTAGTTTAQSPSRDSRPPASVRAMLPDLLGAGYLDRPLGGTCATSREPRGSDLRLQVRRDALSVTRAVPPQRQRWYRPAHRRPAATPRRA
jgi:hypothetical protein